MHIRWTNHPYNPSLNGTEEHAARSVAENAVHFKQAEYVREPKRGDAEWLAWRNKQAAAVTKPGDHDTVAGVIGTQWGILKPKANQSVCIIKRVGSDIFFFTTPPLDCPVAVVNQFNAAVADNPEAHFAAIEKARQEQANRDRDDKAAGNLAVRVAMFGSKPLGQ